MMTTSAMISGTPTTDARRSQPLSRVALVHETESGISSSHTG